MNLKLIKQQYSSYKKIIDIIESGDIHDNRYKLIITSLTPPDVQRMQAIIRELEDKGINLLFKEIN